MRIGLPIAGVSLIIGFLLGIAVYADSANRAGVLVLSDTLLRTLQDRIALETSSYLEPAARATLLAHSMLGRGAATDRAEEAYVFAASVLDQTPQVANVEFADAAGNFMLVRRAAAGPAGAIDTKRIEVSPGVRTVEWITRDKAGHVTERHQDPKDDYDARTRSWYRGARATDDVFWSGVYVFFSERAPGVTAAVHGPDENPDVVGVDIRLDEISRFLSTLPIGRTGRAYIVDKDGEMIAGPDPARILQAKDGQLAPAKIVDIGDPDAAGSWDHYRAGGPGNRTIDVGGKRLISIVTPLSGNSQGWLLLMTVPEEEFSGFVTANSRRAGLLSLSVVALAIGLAGFLVRQGVRSERAARALMERSEAVRQQSAAFARLATEAAGFDAAGRPPPAMTETLAEATGARRAGLWRLLGNGQILRCDDSFERATGGHVSGLELSGQEVPALVAALLHGDEINVRDARRNRVTAALHASWMASFESASLVALPIRQGDRTVGVLLLEDSRSDAAALDLARACATLVAARIPAEAPLPARTAAAATEAPAEPADERGLDPALATADHGPGDQAVVLVARLPDAVLGQASSGPSGTLANTIACAAQEIAAAHAIPYVKMLGATIVAAAGYGAQPDGTAAVRLAEAAIALRERCAALFDGVDDPATFGIGLDAGPVAAGTLGAEPGVFNLWGEAAQGAETLASSAPDGGIQASEQAYRLLRQGFLFRPRGLFYRPRLGESRSYILAGRA